jgi:preprotein translocase subunit SecA
MVRILDAQWKDHLHSMDALRESVGLRGYAQRDPKIEYQREGFALFGEMEDRVDLQVVETGFKFGFPRPRLESTAAAAQGAPGSVSSARPKAVKAPAAAGVIGQAPPGGGAAPVDKVGRNDPCPCGSGKKYKKCHGA